MLYLMMVLQPVLFAYSLKISITVIKSWIQHDRFGVERSLRLTKPCFLKKKTVSSKSGMPYIPPRHLKEEKIH